MFQLRQLQIPAQTNDIILIESCVMKLFKIFGAFVLANSLAGCFSLDIEATVNEDKSLSGTEVQYGSIESLEQLRTYQDDFCSDGELEITNTEFKCIKPFGSMLESDEEITFDGGIVTMTFPLRSGKADDMDEQSKQMQPIIAASFAGQFVNLRITAKEILETNGIISEDGKTASIRIPLDAMIMDTLIRKEFYVKAAYK